MCTISIMHTFIYNIERATQYTQLIACSNFNVWQIKKSKNTHSQSHTYCVLHTHVQCDFDFKNQLTKRKPESERERRSSGKTSMKLCVPRSFFGSPLFSFFSRFVPSIHSLWLFEQFLDIKMFITVVECFVCDCGISLFFPLGLLAFESHTQFTKAKDKKKLNAINRVTI